jgi:flagellar basal-body rod protein FlgG
MLEGLYSAASGMAAQQQRLEALSNDLANVSTAGYKRTRVAFRDLVYARAGRSSAAGIERGAGAAATFVGRGFAQGALRRTEQPLDFAIEGRGFFQVRRPDGSIGLTRDGSFHLDSTGRLVNAQGHLLAPELRMPQGAELADVGIGPDGRVTLRERVVGRIALAEVTSPEGLRSAGDGLLEATPESGPARFAAGSRVVQGVLEGSNVDIGDAMVDMIDAQRSFSLQSKAIQVQDQMMEIANGVKR